VGSPEFNSRYFKKKKRKDLFWLMILEVSVDCHLAELLVGLWRKATHLMVTRKQREASFL
jgi:hypothetical protein